MTIKNFCSRFVAMYRDEDLDDHIDYATVTPGAKPILNIPISDVVAVAERDDGLISCHFIDASDYIPDNLSAWHTVGLPAPAADTQYIVSPLVAYVARMEGRTTDDLLIPDGIQYIVLSDGKRSFCYRGFKKI